MTRSAETAWPFLRFVKLGLIVMALGYAPLQLYIFFGPADGNPIGLGLLFVLGMFAGMVVMAIGLIKTIIGLRR